MDKAVTWERAEKICTDQEGHLVSVASYPELVFLTNLFREEDQVSTVYIGEPWNSQVHFCLSSNTYVC